jgi:hypothetical protein
VFPNGTLIIENVERASDQATYDCVAKNSQGYSARGSLEVQVMGEYRFLFGMIVAATRKIEKVLRTCDIKLSQKDNTCKIVTPK